MTGPVSTGGGAPPPRRRASAAPRPAPAAADVTPAAPPRRVVVDPAPSSTERPAGGRGRGRSARTATPATPATPAGRVRTAPWWLRLVAWIVSVPLGLVLVGVPARALGYLSSQKLLDVVVEEDLGRYVPLAVIVVLWALVTALLVQGIVELGGLVIRRRRVATDGRSSATEARHG